MIGNIAKRCIFAGIICLSAIAAPAQSDGKKIPPHRKIDRIVFKNLEKRGLKPADQVSDEIFMRRVYLDLTGTIPEYQVAKRFIENQAKDKRRALIGRLLKTPEFADYWTLKWCDLLRVKAEFPINLWPNGVHAYARWIKESIAGNKPYDEFVREMLTTSGSNFRKPAVSFYRGVQGEEAESIAAAVALTFMGTRLDKWPEGKRKDVEAFFSRIKFKGTAEWKEVIVCNDHAAAEVLHARFPDGKKVEIKPGDDPRKVFADWLISENNEWFVRNIVNRAWSWFFGYGLIHEPDDIMHDSKAVYPDLLAFLEKEFVASGYDMKHLFRIIVMSRVYQQSSKPSSHLPEGPELFARYPVRQLEAEVIVDALGQISGMPDDYMSMIPEPFTFVPSRNSAVQLVDGSITSKFLKTFGRPSRDTGLESERGKEPTADQRLHMLNSTHVQDKIERSWKLRNFAKNTKNKKEILDYIYLSVLSRYPTKEEVLKSKEYAKEHGNWKGQRDILWALVNSKEFLCRH